MRHRTFFLFLAAMALLFSPAGGQAPTDDAQQDTLIRSIISRHEATVQQLETIPLFVEFAWRTKTTLERISLPDGADLSGPVVMEGRTRYWRNGESFREDREQKNTWTVSGEVRNLDSVFLITDRYAVDYRRNNPVLSLFHFDDRTKLPQSLELQVEIHPNPDIIDFGVRYSERQTLMETYEQQTRGGQPSHRWTVSEIAVDGKVFHKIVVEKVKGETKRLHQELLLDPDCGYLISDRRTYDKTGEPFYVVEASFQAVADGIWFPKSVSLNIEQGNNVKTLEVEKISLDVAEIRSKLSLEALDIDRESITMIDHPNDGALKRMKGYLDGEWVPIETLPPERVAVIEQARSRANAARD